MLMRFDPFDGPSRLAERVTGIPAGSLMAMDAWRREGELTVEFDLPGVEPDTIDVTAESGALTVKAERRWTPAEGVEVVAHERPYGTVTRRLLLGDALDVEQLQAQYHDGVLTLRVPVAEKAQPRKITVGSERPAIAA